MEKEIYVVNAYRFGNRENHSYTVGVFSKKNAAIKCVDSHSEYRGGKYSCVVERCVMNCFENSMDEYTVEIYRTQPVLNTHGHIS